MKERLIGWKNALANFWGSRTLFQKSMAIGSILLLFIVIGATTMLATKKNFVPLYSNLSAQETGQIKATLDSKGIESQISDSGTTISVPEEAVDTLKVQLAAEGIPDSGNIDYKFFGQNAGFGMTDNQFDVLKLEAMQTELSNLIKGIEGVNDAKVMISLPEPSVFVGDEKEAAQASIVLNTKPGYKFEQQQIKALYHLVSKSVPNLPNENIVIMNQNFEYFDLEDEEDFSAGKTFATQNQIKKEIERDIQRQVQQMLGTMMGRDKVVVEVTADLDFTQENREENLVTPVDPENMEGLKVSVERITENFSGKGAQAGGVAGTGDTDVTNYPAGAENSDGDYERTEERINNEVNKIRKQIVESPYKVRDLGIQVMVEPPDPKDRATFTPEMQEDVQKILGTIIRTSIDKNAMGQAELTDEQINQKVAISVQEFGGKVEFPSETKPVIPVWLYILGGVLLLLIAVLIVLLIRKKRKEKLTIQEEAALEPALASIPDVNDEQETEASMRRKQLEKMAKEKPEDFAKLLRTWLAED